jgi:hypothetical protein
MFSNSKNCLFLFKSIRQNLLCAYNETKSILAPRVRFQFPHDPVAPKIVSRFPGPAHLAALEKVSATQCIDGQSHVSK